MRIQQQIEKKLLERFGPLHLEVSNESHMHNVPEGSESHFRIVLVSAQFEEKPLIKRHRAVNATLQEELSGQIHALALHTMTPEEWFAKGGDSGASPPLAVASRDLEPGTLAARAADPSGRLSHLAKGAQARPG